MTDILDRIKEIQAFANSKGKVPMSQEFVKHFTAVCKYYECTPAEIGEMKDAVRRDRDEAILCYKTMYEEL